jgi:hypothetical protein
MTKDRKDVSFAEAEGRDQYPDVLKWGELDQRLRAALWNRFWIYFDRWVEEAQYDADTNYLPPLHDILIREFVHRRHGFANEFKESFQSKETCIAHWAAFFRKADYVELFDFITFFLRDRDCPDEVIKEIAGAIDGPWSPYRLLLKPPTVFPAISPEEATVLKRDLTTAFSSKFGGARTHLRLSLDVLNKGDYRAVVRESIHAVESAVRDFTGDQSAILSRALKKLTDESGLHPALSNAFDKLYAYSSDEKRIRHALVFQENEKVGFDEAMFFVSACSAFIGLLSRKATQKNS